MKIMGTNVESTPFLYVDVVTPDDEQYGWFKLYWTAKSGTYGHQVVYEGVCRKASYSFSGKTAGCGFSKIDNAFDKAVREIIGDENANEYQISSLGVIKGNYKKVSLAFLKGESNQ